ncbi:benzoyl-CoA reductase/2-hydroxyglutaryl-CoA dehydratase subunit BcrC/BadD/HgdB [Anaerobacterium chartisolvens]|uniref:Benzoyl-CoA reductase/2-hydroxyglutaryl-CoA dehydratase subunit BcrC/BadD/HgdB n=1 Tax=Anaerobacterium chartisolvens TaxID=1297424 RepID=A0A369BFA4_9FIRM|nr:2-hydroxyacyl-CoA dehydratase [Anaerobacterium chartisolvens]RCX20202.1 benzoyl-CoA reductase/2-hydroxyglutaryl-CoA dehydratase subunit BcrC/BadD/HgdB [Anaerobacterium chartisolvens]
MNKIGFTTSIPVEVIFAADLIPVDLNNVFITAANPGGYIEKAENAGFPRSTCAWIKGIYSAILDKSDIATVIGVVEGDCSNTRALIEVLELNGIKSIPFSYPNSRDYHQLKCEIIKLCDIFNVSIERCKEVKKELDVIRKKLAYIDELTWKHNKATGMENHIWQVSSSDFNGCCKAFDSELSEKIREIEERESGDNYIRLGYIGVPPINSDLYDFIEGLNARVIFNEVQRQFTMAHGIGNEDIVEVYRQFTYPYSLNNRLEDIKKQIELRKIDGIIHCTQAFCFRGIEDIVIRRQLPEVPILTFECDRPGPLDARTRLRIEAFIDMISP